MWQCHVMSWLSWFTRHGDGGGTWSSSASREAIAVTSSTPSRPFWLLLAPATNTWNVYKYNINIYIIYWVVTFFLIFAKERRTLKDWVMDIVSVLLIWEASHTKTVMKRRFGMKEKYRLHLFLTDSIGDPVFVVFSSAVTTKRIYLLWWWLVSCPIYLVLSLLLTADPDQGTTL